MLRSATVVASVAQRPLAVRILATSLLLALATNSLASDLYRNGASPRSLGMGGVAGLARDPLAAMSNNPAFLAGQSRQLQASLETFVVDADLTTKPGERTSADSGPALVPELAFVLPLADTAFTLGAAVKVESGMKASFEYVDPPGTLGVSYGRQKHESEYLALNTSLALGWQVNDSLQLGAQAGIAFNRNRLQAPYIFQSHPALASLKVLVDLEAEDYAPTAALGLNWQVSDALSLNLAWRMESRFSATGTTSGNLAALGLGIQPDFAYDTAVKTGLPASLSAGINYRYSPTLRLGVQVDHIDWSRTFAQLPIVLTNGSNTQLNDFLGSSSILDTAPLDWDDQWVRHFGVEQKRGGIAWRAGYEHSDVPVPTATLTPMTAAIFKHALSGGVSFTFGGRPVDVHYRYSFSGNETRVRDSRLLGGEHNGQALDLQLHSLGLAFSF